MDTFYSLLRRISCDAPKHLFPWAVTATEQIWARRRDMNLADVMAEKAREHGLEPGSIISSAPHEDMWVVYPPNWQGAQWSWERDKLWRAMEEEMRRPPPLTLDELRDDPC